jgi:hypothetical protein
MGNGVMPNGLSYRAHPRLYLNRLIPNAPASAAIGGKADPDQATLDKLYVWYMSCAA